MKEIMLTTIDNPYDPFDDFKNWFLCDITKGYSSCSYIARVMEAKGFVSSTISDEEYETMIDEIIISDVVGIYKKVVREVSENEQG